GRCSRSGANWPSPDLGAREDGMQGSTWLSVLGRIPAQQHDSLVIVTTTGCEIVLREIVRVEEEFIILRGRMAGSTAAGPVVILPFDQINSLGFNKLIPEAQLKAMFSGTPAALVSPANGPAVVAQAVPTTAATGPDAPPSAPDAGTGDAAGAGEAGKA